MPGSKWPTMCPVKLACAASATGPIRLSPRQANPTNHKIGRWTGHGLLERAAHDPAAYPRARATTTAPARYSSTAHPGSWCPACAGVMSRGAGVRAGRVYQRTIAPMIINRMAEPIQTTS